MAKRKKTKNSKIDRLYSRFGERIVRLAALVSAMSVLVGTATGLCTWGASQITNDISNQLDSFRQEVKASDNIQNQSITRLELMNLIQNDPTNVAGIEKLARHYFGDLNGNQYMTGLYSKWCAEYGGDPNIAVGGK